MTSQRYARTRQMLATRQPSLTVCIERVHKPHNISAVIRTADAVGTHQIHAIWPGKQLRPTLSNAARSNSWVSVQTHLTITSAMQQLTAQDMQILATHLSQQAVDFRSIDYTRPTCILMGQEKIGLSAQALALSDQQIIIPMVGMVQSLNVSVACALILYEAQRHQAGMYHRYLIPLSEEEQQRLLWEGGYPVLANVAKRQALSRPWVDDNGQIVAPQPWWDAMQASQPAIEPDNERSFT